MKASDIAEAHTIAGELAFLGQSLASVSSADPIYCETAGMAFEKGEDGFDVIRAGLIRALGTKIKNKEARLRDIGVAFEPGSLTAAPAPGTLPK